MQHDTQAPSILDFNLNPKSGVLTLTIKGDLGTYDWNLDHPIIEIFNAVMGYASSPLRLAALKKPGDEMEYIHFTPEFPIYSEEDNITICKFDPCNNHGVRSQIIFFQNTQETFFDFLPILKDSLKSFFRRPAGYDLYEQKLEQIKSIDRQMKTLNLHIGKSGDTNSIARAQSHLANLAESRERKARELKEGLRDFLTIVGLPIPASKIRFRDEFANHVADLLEAGEGHAAEKLIFQKNFCELLEDYAEDDPA